MRKLPGLFTVVAAVTVLSSVNVAFATPPSGQYSETEYGRGQQTNSGKVFAGSGHDVDSSTYTVAPGGDTGWRTGPGSTALIVTRGSLKVEQAEGCASQDLAAGKALVLPAAGGASGQLHQPPPRRRNAAGGRRGRSGTGLCRLRRRRRPRRDLHLEVVPG
jgi:quercetin dioxygenase-like cupin family protein